MFWPNVGRQYLDFFGQAVAEKKRNSARPLRRSALFNSQKLREVLLSKGL
jgi:hypothetical protein